MDTSVTLEKYDERWSTSWGWLILRLGVGGYLLTHGWGKLQMLIDGNYTMLGDPIGLGPKLSLFLVMFAEFVCAILVMAGLATRIAAAVVVFSMGVAVFVAHATNPWTMEEGFKQFMAHLTPMPISREPAMMYLIPFLALAVAGAGRLSLDAIVWPWIQHRRTGHAVEEKVHAGSSM
ncbi:MAG TPA: DoxX family protein [Planctomycetota bacterium]|nr:DoxX family protein [Planctomycetota bacterium]